MVSCAFAESVIPEIKHQDEVRVKIASSGLCGSDLPRIFKNGAHYYPITLGHEFSGYIDAVGSGVDDLHPDDAVGLCAVITLFYLSRVSERVLFPVRKI
ncbi:galactitol-1-phosphate 5-dehydrogenase [Escherichia coli]|uniref:Galactitol-1-phosphate 5-dehydrogenase n=1 Tax=Escherichia coli TaxID=562 RepID=A0A376KV70_ECOLX|nr:galactitol-1-phosphate 5-dehydrogenase [Escherichia coli]